MSLKHDVFFCITAELSGMYGASDRRSVSAGHFCSNDFLEARESARAGNELFEFTQLGRCRRAQRACNAKPNRTAEAALIELRSATMSVPLWRVRVKAYVRLIFLLHYSTPYHKALSALFHIPLQSVCQSLIRAFLIRQNPHSKSKLYEVQ